MTPESLPYVVDKAIREALRSKRCSSSCNLQRFWYVEIPDVDHASTTILDAKAEPSQHQQDEVDKFLELVKNAKRPFAIVLKKMLIS